MHGQIELEEMDESTLEKFLELVHSYTGITMSSAKKTLLQGRIRPRIKKLNLPDYISYIDYLKNDPIEKQQFIDIVTTHETSFFRTQRVWEFFQKEFLPNWFRHNSGKTLKIWSAAASSGEEVYTIGVCCEEFLAKNPLFSYQILGTDISTSVLDMAEKGEYAGRSIDNFKSSNADLFFKYLRDCGEKFRVREVLKSRIRFVVHNLSHKPPEANAFDIVFLRNVLIYFSAADQTKVLLNMGISLVNKGVLVIGESESLHGLKTSFDFKSPLIYQKNENDSGK